VKFSYTLVNDSQACQATLTQYIAITKQDLRTSAYLVQRIHVLRVLHKYLRGGEGLGVYERRVSFL
jgi:hypothetical protein